MLGVAKTRFWCMIIFRPALYSALKPLPYVNAGIDLGLGARVRVRDGLNPNPVPSSELN